MKRYRFLWLSLLAILSFQCSNEFDLVADWKDIPVVYALLSQSDNVHYIRVEKAFLDKETSALEVAKNADSLYYDNAIVQLERVETGDVFNLQKVDGTNIGFPRDEGIFATSPNYLYKIDANQINLREGERYRLIINRGEGLTEVTAETTIIGEHQFIQAAPANPIDWQYERDVTITWRTDDEAAVFYELKIIVHYEETDPNNSSQFIDKSVEWIVDKDIRREEGVPRVTYEIPGISFYQFLGTNIKGPSNVNRIFRRLDIVVVGGGQELFDYINIGKANVGITSSQVIPTYTNLSEGFGVFSSRVFFDKNNFTVSSMTRDSLRDGIFTKDLNFQ